MSPHGNLFQFYFHFAFMSSMQWSRKSPDFRLSNVSPSMRQAGGDVCLQKPNCRPVSIDGFICRGGRTCEVPLMGKPPTSFSRRFYLSGWADLRSPLNGETADQFRSTVLSVGVGGLEPPTPASQTRCAANCATPRYYQSEKSIMPTGLLVKWIKCEFPPIPIIFIV